MTRWLRRHGATLVALVGFLILIVASPDGKFNGGDLIGWILLVLGIMRNMHPVPAKDNNGGR
jgi:hypothetical protein